jgi:hypothetical protein
LLQSKGSGTGVSRARGGHMIITGSDFLMDGGVTAAY